MNFDPETYNETANDVLIPAQRLIANLQQHFATLPLDGFVFEQKYCFCLFMMASFIIGRRSRVDW